MRACSQIPVIACQQAWDKVLRRDLSYGWRSYALGQPAMKKSGWFWEIILETEIKEIEINRLGNRQDGNKW